MANFKLSGPFKIPEKKVKRIIFLFHGYGANGDDLIDLADEIGQKIPDAAFYAPNAPFPLPPMVFFMAAGYEWYPLDGYDPVKFKTDRKSFENLCEKRMGDVEKLLPSVWAFIEEKANEHNVESQNIAIAGFSQGGMMALSAALFYNKPLAGVVSFSGVPLTLNCASKVQNKIPVLLSHGNIDDVVPDYSLDITNKTLGSIGIIPELHTSINAGHTIDNTALDKAILFLEKICYKNN